MPVKPSILLVVTRNPGTCGGCRHANQSTVDFAEGLVFCQFGGGVRSAGSPCDQPACAVPRVRGPVEDGYYYWEPYAGSNGTWGYRGDSRILAEDADEAMRASLQADIPRIEADPTGSA